MITLHDIMTVDVITVEPEATLREVAELLSSEHISGVPVVDGDEVVGVVSATDVLEVDASGEEDFGREPDQLAFEDEPGAELWEEGEEPPASYFVRLWEEQDRLDGEAFGREREAPEEGGPLDRYTAADVMTRQLCMLPSSSSARDGAEYMLRAGIHRLLVIDGEELVGVVTTTDLVKAVSQYGLAG
ncbi:MAG: CBS domain-containing protein [Gemmatimonadota bacterium]